MTIDELRNIIDYDPNTGELTRDGRPVGYVSQHGYRCLTVNNKTYRGHRLAYALHHGHWPRHEIDHIDGDKLNNRIDNLRDVPHHINAKNQRMRHTNKTGVMGVTRQGAKFKAMINIKRMDYERGTGYPLKYLGLFDDFFDAICARKSAENRYGYHANHGR